jgi:hypothetical protein
MFHEDAPPMGVLAVFYSDFLNCVQQGKVRAVRFEVSS